MKKALSVLLAGAMVAGMSVSAFATAKYATVGHVYDEDGEDSGDVFDSTKTVEFLADGSANDSASYKLDGVLPGVTFYMPLGKEMSSIIKTKATYTNADLVAQLVTDGKVTKVGVDTLTTSQSVLSEADFKTAISVTTAGTVPAGAYVEDNHVYTLTSSLAETDLTAAKTTLTANDKVSLTSLTDDDLFKFDVDKDDGSKYIKDINVKEDKKLGDLERTAYLEFILNDSTTTDDLKSTGTITFEAKNDAADEDVKNENWSDGEDFSINYTFWINNEKKEGSDEDADTGDRVYFDPEDNEDNTFVWGDDRAAMFFEGNDDAGAFYVRLQTKVDSSIYAEYADPVNADLWFYDFVGNPTIPSTSRATVTLGIPWDEDDDYTPNPEDCFIYEMDADGYLNDVTDLFTYDDENDGTTEIEGWTIKTRKLGTYVISDTELDVEVYEEVEEEEAPEVEEEVAAPADDVKAIPNTGSSDMVGAAVVAAVVSLAAAGAVAFKKASK